MPLKQLTYLDAQILKLREEIAASNVAAEKIAELDKLISERITLVNALSANQRAEAENRRQA